MKLSLFPVLLSISAAGAFFACGGSTTSGNVAPQPDAGTTTDEGGAGDDGGTGDDASADTGPTVDHGKPSTTYPAFKPEMPTLQGSSAAVLTAPKIVTVTWDTDPNVTQLEAFSDTIGNTDYWKAVTSEYGVGKATSGGHVHVPGPLPTSFDVAQEMDSFVDNGVANGWPSSSAQTIYLVNMHPGINVTAGGSPACQVFGGYHSLSQNGNIYAVALPCTTGTRALDTLTVTGSHELAEAATDPRPGGGSRGYFGFDQNHVAWSMFQRGQVEDGDACEFYSDAEYKEAAPFAFQVQRQWSNAAAAAAHNPCVPAAPGPYFGATPLMLEDVAYQGRNGGTTNTKGFHIPVGTTKTFAVGFFSDGPTSGPFSIRAAEGFTPNVGGPMSPHLSVSVDKTSGVNGEIAYVTVTVNKGGTTLGGRTYANANYVTVLASLNGATHFMPILITTN